MKSENLNLIQSNDKLQGGFMSLNTEKMNKIKGGINSNSTTCSNGGSCPSSNTGSCSNTGTCSSATNSGTCTLVKTR